MQKFQKSIGIAVILSETSHIFCCVLPTLMSVLSLLAGIGVIGSLPVSLLVVHDWLHAWELPIIVVSGVLIALGWGLHLYSKKIDCHDTGCGHGPCEPKKDRSSLFLTIATGLFLVNITVYFVFHRHMAPLPTHEQAIEAQQHNHGAHDHGHAH